MKKHILIFLLSLFIRKKKDKLIVLYFNGEKFVFNTRIFFQYLLKNSDYEIKYIINNEDKRKELEKIYGDRFLSLNNLKELILVLKARAWIVDGGFPLKTPFGHKDRILINFWHGSPIKHIGLDGYKGLSRLRVWLQLKMVAKHYNAFFIISEKFREIMKKAFLLTDDKIKLLGQPRNDLLYRKNDGRKIIRKLYGNTVEFNKIVLYAPTYRGEFNGKLEKTKYFPFRDFDKQDFEYFLEENKILFFVRNHHLDEIEIEETERIKFLGNDKIEDISEILNIFDLLISDYSGMIFDYLHTQKPMLFLPYDLEEYIKNTGLYFDYSKVSPGPKPQNYNEFKEDIYRLLTDEDYYRDKREEMTIYFSQVGDGNCKRAFDFLEGELKK